VLLLGGQPHLEALVVEVHDLVEIRRGAVVKVGRARREAAQ
jgi:hypothetical protein